MPKFRVLSIILALWGSGLPVNAQAELRLETWSSYGQLAEQGAICASFSALMESQSVLNPDLGTLWQERRKFAGAVIRKAVLLELKRDSTEDEINKLIASYRDWVLSSLMIDDGATNTLLDESGQEATPEILGRQKIKDLVNSQCKSLFEQGDVMIRQQNPQLAYLLDDTPASAPASAKQAETAGPRRVLAAPNAVVTSPEQDILPETETNTTTDTKTNTKTEVVSADRPEQNKAAENNTVKLSIGSGNSFTLTLPGQKPAKSQQTAEPSSKDLPAKSEQKKVEPETKEQPAPVKLANISGPAPRPVRPQKLQTDRPASDSPPQTEPTNRQILPNTDLIPVPPKQTATETNTKGTQDQAEQTSASPVRATISNLLDQQAAATVNLTTPVETSNSQKSSPSNSVYFAQLGAFSRLENATAEKQRLEQKFVTLFSKLPLKITEVNDAGPRFFRIRTAELNQRQTKAVCDLLWPHRIACLVKPEKTR